MARETASLSRRGFTLVELLVVIGIIAILMALIVPAVQRAREAASRTECSNNLRQLGIAVHQHHSTHRSFPAGQRYSAKDRTYNYMSWLAQLLPFVEQDALWRTTVKAYQSNPAGVWNDPPHVGNSTLVPTFTCPSDALGSNLRHPAGTVSGYQAAYTSYVGVMGRDLQTLNGVLYRESWIRFADITDGASNTLLAGERPPGLDGEHGKWYADFGQDFSGSTGNIMGVREKNVGIVTAGSCPPGYYEFSPGRFNDPCAYFHFWSPHPGGAHFLFADGSVHFLQYSAAPLLPALASRAGGEAVALP